MDDVTLARAFHVLAIIHWIGGMAVVTLVVLPLACRVADPHEGLALFESVERRFSAQVRLSVPVAGLSGFYMAERLDAWARFLDPAQWWLGGMLLLWLLFMTILFVVEPAIGVRLLEAGRSDPAGLLSRVARVHWLLLGASAAVAGTAVLGAHGLLG